MRARTLGSGSCSAAGSGSGSFSCSGSGSGSGSLSFSGSGSASSACGASTRSSAGWSASSDPPEGACVGGADHGQLGADLDGLVLVDLDLQQRAGDGGGDLGVDLVGGDLEQRLVDRDLVADLLEPAGDGALGDGLAERGQRHRRAGPAATAAGRGGRLGRLGSPESAGLASPRVARVA